MRTAMMNVRKQRNGTRIAYVYRDRADGSEEEIEVEVDGDLYRAEPDVGLMRGGYEVQGAVRTDNGEPIALTEDEANDIEMEALEEAADRAEEAAERRYESQEDR